MYIRQQIELYEEYTEQIIRAINAEDNAEVARIDPQLSQAYQKILSVAPADMEARTEQLAYLLDQLVPTFERTVMQNQICDRLVELISGDEANNLQAD